MRCSLLSLVFALVLSQLAVAGDDEGALLRFCKQSVQNVAYDEVAIVQSQGRDYLVAIGFSRCASEDVRSLLAARKTARLNALRAMHEFVNETQVSSVEEVVKWVRVEEAHARRDVAKEYVSCITSRAEGVLRGIEDVGYWRIAEEKMLFCGIAVPIGETDGGN